MTSPFMDMESMFAVRDLEVPLRSISMVNGFYYFALVVVFLFPLKPEDVESSEKPSLLIVPEESVEDEEVLPLEELEELEELVEFELEDDVLLDVELSEVELEVELEEASAALTVRENVEDEESPPAS